MIPFKQELGNNYMNESVLTRRGATYGVYGGTWGNLITSWYSKVAASIEQLILD